VRYVSVMDEKLLNQLALVCSEAGALLLDFRRTGVVPTSKAGMELLTEADTASEELLCRTLGGVMPGVPFVGEEGFSGPLPDPPFWIADPLDGTNNFAFDFPFFCVSAAFVDESGPRFCCTFDPVRTESFTAIRGEGAFLNGRRIRCLEVSSLSDALMATGFPYNRTPGSINTDLGVLEHFLGFARGIRRSGSAALDLAYTACGRLGAYWEKTLRPWDMAAGALLVREAGGIVGAYEGGDWNLSSGGMCASAPRLWAALREGIEKGRQKDAPFRT